MSIAVNPSDGIRIAYEDVGAGPAVVLLHGSGLSRGSWRGLGYIRALREKYRVLAVDLRGHGRSDKPHAAEAYAMSTVVADVCAVLDDADIAGAAIVGYSLGARVGFSLIDTQPHRVNSFVSLGGTFRSLAGSVADVFFEGFDDALRGGGMPEFIARWGEARGRPVDAPTAAAFLANDPQALAAYFERAGSEGGLEESRLAQLDTPSLLIAGTLDHDRFVDSRLAASAMPNARFVSLEGRGHGDTLAPSAPIIELIEEALS